MSRLLEQVLNQVLNAQDSPQLQAEPYARSNDHQGYRNGTRLHPLTHRATFREAIHTMAKRSATLLVPLALAISV